jgi:hypothetical protein
MVQQYERLYRSVLALPEQEGAVCSRLMTRA